MFPPGRMTAARAKLLWIAMVEPMWPRGWASRFSIAMDEWRRFFLYPGMQQLRAFVSGGRISILSTSPAAARCIGESFVSRARHPGPFLPNFHRGARVEGGRKQQVRPLRYASVGLTLLLRELFPIFPMKCHPDRSVAKWRDLLFPSHGVTLRSSFAEEGAQQLPAFLRQLSARHQHLMIQAGMIQHLQHRADSAGLGIGSGIDEAG